MSAKLARTVGELFAYPSSWIKEHYAVNVNGDPVRPDDDSACKWCLAGAVGHIYGFGSGLWVILDRLARHLGCTNADPATVMATIVCWNDQATFEDVQRVTREMAI